VGAGHGEDHRRARGEAEGGARRSRVGRRGELGADRDARHDDALGGDAARDELVLHLVGGHAVAAHVRGDPLAVGHEVGDDRGVRGDAAALGHQGRHRRGGRGVDGDDHVGRDLVEERGQASRPHARHPEGEHGVAGDAVAHGVGETPEGGRPPQHGVVEGARGPIEQRVHQLPEVVHHTHLTAGAREGRGQAARGGVVAGAVGGGEDEDAGHRLGVGRTRR
jgi:hypothetical protein